MSLDTITKTWPRPGKNEWCGIGWAIKRVPAPCSWQRDGCLLPWFAEGWLDFGKWHTAHRDGFLASFTNADYPYGFHLLPTERDAFVFWRYYWNTTPVYARHDWVLAELEWCGLLADGVQQINLSPLFRTDPLEMSVRVIVVNRVCLLGVVSEGSVCF